MSGAQGPLLSRNTYIPKLFNFNNVRVVEDEELFIAGDVRCGSAWWRWVHILTAFLSSNENPALCAIITVLAAEHNRLATEFKAKHPDWDGARDISQLSHIR